MGCLSVLKQTMGNVSVRLSSLAGCGVNLGMRGLESLGRFIYRTATAVDRNDVLEALSAKIQHSKQVAESFRQTGLASAMFQWGRSSGPGPGCPHTGTCTGLLPACNADSHLQLMGCKQPSVTVTYETVPVIAFQGLFFHTLTEGVSRSTLWAETQD